MNMQNTIRRPLCVVCLIFLFASGLRMLSWEPEEEVQFLVPLQGQECAFAGRVAKTETKSSGAGAQTILYLEQGSLYQPAEPLPREVSLVCYMKQGVSPRIGSAVFVKGTFSLFEEATNPGEFDALLYNRILGQDGRLWDTELLMEGEKYHFLKQKLSEMKSILKKKLRRSYGEKEAGIMETMLLGDKTGLDQEVSGLYRQAGILHILSVSGLHISILGYGVYRLLRRAGWGMRPAALAAMLLLCSYGVMIGAGVSAFRAIVMFAVQMLAEWWGRTYDLPTALAVAAALLAALQPAYWYHSGFWLSFSCVAAIGCFYPVLQLPDKKKENSGVFFRLGKALKEGLLLGISIGLVTLPVFMWFYYEVSWQGMILNLAVIPLMTVVINAGLLVLLLPQSWTLVNGLLAEMGSGVLVLFEKLCQWAEKLWGGGLITGKPQSLSVLVYALGLTVLTLFHKKIKYGLRIVSLMGLLAILLFRAPAGFQLTFLDVGQGDGICIQSGSGEVYLVDGGSSSKKKVGTYQLLPFLKQAGIRSIDAVLVSHADEDHISGVRELLETENSVKVKRLIVGGVEQESLYTEYADLLALCRKRQIAVSTIEKGDAFEAGGVKITCLHPPRGYQGGSNEASQVLFLEYGAFSALLTGDVEGKGETLVEEELRKKGIQRITVLKTAHHGSGNSTPESLLEQLMPQIAIISCGENNSYGHPHADLLKRLEQTGARIYRTDESGAITVRSNGEKVWVDKWNGNKYTEQ